MKCEVQRRLCDSSKMPHVFLLNAFTNHYLTKIATEKKKETSIPPGLVSANEECVKVKILLKIVVEKNHYLVLIHSKSRKWILYKYDGIVHSNVFSQIPPSHR